MASLKDIKTRISSVKTTRQVTSAMKMVSAARLKKAQDDIYHIRPFTSRLAGIIHDLMPSVDEYDRWFMSPGKGDKVLVIAIASNRGLCGAFNQNIVREVSTLLSTTLKEDSAKGNIHLVVLGKQAEKMFTSRRIHVDEYRHNLVNSSLYAPISEFAAEVIDGYNKGQYKQVVVVYNEFVNAALQNVRTSQFLPIVMPTQTAKSRLQDYIFEPDTATIVKNLIPRMLQAMLYQVVLESIASEHGARMTSMHKATDNATELIRELELSYNKARQASITNQIVEITGGAEALKGGS